MPDGLRFAAAAWLVSLCSIAFSQSLARDLEPRVADGPPRAEEIVDRALERTAKKDESGIEFEFESIVNSVVERLDAGGGVTAAETKRSHRYPLEGYFYEEVVGRDGRALTPGEARKEQRRKAAFARGARKRAARGEEPGLDRSRIGVRFNHELMDRYRKAVVGSEEVVGHACWVVRFEPREGKLPSAGGMDRALNQSTGTLWIKKSNYQVVRVSFAMEAPVRYLWGLFATLRQAAGQIEFAPVEAGLWMPSRFQIELDLQLLLGVKAIRRRVRNEWSDYRRVAAVGVFPQVSR